MEGLISQEIERSELREGDHIYSWRKLGVYSHHGIYIGNGRVIHFMNPNRGDATTQAGLLGPLRALFSSSTSQKPGTCHKQVPDCRLEKVPGSGVKLTCLDCFLKDDGALHRYKYGVSKAFLLGKLRGGTCTMFESDPVEEVIHRATYLLEHGYGKYDQMNNNCEDFALYCKTGLLSNDVHNQGRSGQANTVRRTTSPKENCVDVLDQVGDYVQRAAMAIPRSFVKRLNKDLGKRDDVVKVPVEAMASFIQTLHETAERKPDGDRK